MSRNNVNQISFIFFSLVLALAGIFNPLPTYAAGFSTALTSPSQAPITVVSPVPVISVTPTPVPTPISTPVPTPIPTPVPTPAATSIVTLIPTAVATPDLETTVKPQPAEARIVALLTPLPAIIVPAPAPIVKPAVEVIPTPHVTTDILASFPQLTGREPFISAPFAINPLLNLIQPLNPYNVYTSFGFGAQRTRLLYLISIVLGLLGLLQLSGALDPVERYFKHSKTSPNKRTLK